MNNKPNWWKKELKDIEAFEGKGTKASGRTWSDPGDLKTKDWLIDSKFTEKKSYSISLKTWDKLYEQALLNFRRPLLSLQIQDTEMVILDKSDFLSLLQNSSDTE